MYARQALKHLLQLYLQDFHLFKSFFIIFYVAVLHTDLAFFFLDCLVMYYAYQFFSISTCRHTEIPVEIINL